MLIMVNRGAWATMGELPVGLPHSSCVGMLALYFCGYCTEVLRVKLCLGEQRGTKDCTEEYFGRCLSISGNTFWPCREPQDFWYHTVFKGEPHCYLCHYEVITRMRWITLKKYIFNRKWNFIYMQLMLIWKVCSSKYVVWQELLESTKKGKLLSIRQFWAAACFIFEINAWKDFYFF